MPRLEQKGSKCMFSFEKRVTGRGQSKRPKRLFVEKLNLHVQQQSVHICFLGYWCACAVYVALRLPAAYRSDRVRRGEEGGGEA